MMNFKDIKVLYIEDDQMSREVIEFILKKIMGISDVSYFEDSRDYMKRLEALGSIPDLILLDIQIHPTDGYQILRSLRADHRYNPTKIVALTANVMSHDVAKLQQSGFDGLIGKPIIHRMFPEMIGRILAGESIWYIP